MLTPLEREIEALLLSMDADQGLALATSSASLPDLPNKKDKTNWVEKAGGLPGYIERIAKHLHSEKGMDVSRAIATAVNTVKRWCAGGDDVKADTKAKACKAVASWEAKKAKGGKKLSAAEDHAVVRHGCVLYLSDADFIDERGALMLAVLDVETLPPEAFNYGQYLLSLSQARLDLAGPISFDPKLHPKDYKGRFRDTVKGLKAGSTVKLPDGTSVTAVQPKDKKRLEYEMKDPDGKTFQKDADYTVVATAALRKTSAAGEKDRPAPDELEPEGSTLDEFVASLDKMGNDEDLLEAIQRMRKGEQTGDDFDTVQDALDGFKDIGNDPKLEGELERLLEDADEATLSWGSPKERADAGFGDGEDEPAPEPKASEKTKADKDIPEPDAEQGDETNPDSLDLPEIPVKPEPPKEITEDVRKERLKKIVSNPDHVDQMGDVAVRDALMEYTGSPNGEDVAGDAGPLGPLKPAESNADVNPGEALKQAFEDDNGRIQIDSATEDSVSFSLPGGDDEENDYHLTKGTAVDDMPWVVTGVEPDQWVLTELPMDAYDDEIDDYDPELLTHHILDDPAEAYEVLKDRMTRLS